MDSLSTATLVSTAIGVALSPAAIVEMILIVFSRRRVVNSIVFVVSLWVLIAAVLVIGGLGARVAGADGGPGLVPSIVIGALGLLLVGVGVRNWMRRRDTSEPAIFATISRMGPGAVALLSFGVVVVNPKNLPLVLSAGDAVAASGMPLLVGALFLLIATLPHLATTLYAILGGESANRRLNRLRAWLVRRNRLIMGVLCILFGALLLLRGVSGALAA